MGKAETKLLTTTYGRNLIVMDLLMHKRVTAILAFGSYGQLLRCQSPPKMPDCLSGLISKPIFFIIFQNMENIYAQKRVNFFMFPCPYIYM